MQRLEVSGAVRPIYGSLGVNRLRLGSYIRGNSPRLPYKDQSFNVAVGKTCHYLRWQSFVM